METLQGTFLTKEDNKVTFATADGQVKYGYSRGEATLTPNTAYVFTVETKVSKAGKNYTAISGITDMTGKSVVAEPVKKAWVGGGSKFSPEAEKLKQEGMTRGNYRTCLTTYVCACLAKGTQPDINWFNTIVKQGEERYFSTAQSNALKQPSQAGAVGQAPIGNLI